MRIFFFGEMTFDIVRAVNRKPAKSILPKRVYMMDQILKVLRERIASGDWGEYIPSERALAERMKVGRTTLRQAIARLEKDGVIEAGQRGRRRKIIGTPSNPEARHSRRAVLLTPYDPHRLSSFLLREVDVLRRCFNQAQIRLDTLSSKAYNVENCSNILQRLTHLESADLWMLQMAPYQVHKWFDQHREIPSMAIGYTFPDMSLPFATENNVAAARHAVGMLSGRGHRSIALLIPESTLAGDVAMRSVMEKTSESLGVRFRAIVYRNVPNDLCKRVDEVLEIDDRPTALITTMTTNVMTCISHLARRRMAVPDDISIVSILDDPSLDNIVPEVTRYTVNEDAFMRQVFTMAEKIMDGRFGSYKHEQRIPELIKGRTVASI